MRTRSLLALLAAGVLLQGCGDAHADYRTDPPEPNLLHTAMGQLTSVIVDDIFSPPQASRVYAVLPAARRCPRVHDRRTRAHLLASTHGLAAQRHASAVPEHGRAAAEVLTDQFGDGFAFNDTTQVAYGLPARSFTSFRQVAAEAAISRLYGGIHYRMAIEEGSVQGRRVGEHVIRRTRPARAVAQLAR